MNFKVKLPNKEECQIIGRIILGLAEKLPNKKNLITINPNQSKKEKLNTLIHECLHQLNWNWTEKKVSKQADFIAEVVWKAGFRMKR